MEFPKDLQYTKEHEWIRTSGSTVEVGVTAYAIEQLGDIVHVELPSAGETFSAGAAFGTIESTKTVSDLYMPVSGKISAVNNEAAESPDESAGEATSDDVPQPADTAAADRRLRGAGPMGGKPMSLRA